MADLRSPQPIDFDKYVWHVTKERIFYGAALLLMVVGQIEIFLVPNTPAANIGVALLVLGAIMSVALRKVHISRAVGVDPKSPAETVSASPVSIRVTWLIVACALAVLTAWRSAIRPPEASAWELLLTWGLSMLALLFAVKTQPNHQGTEKRLLRWEYALLVVLFAAALFIRGINLGSEPRVLDTDEAKFALVGSEIHQAHFIVSPFEPTFHSYSMLHSTLIAALLDLLGQTLVAARLPSALLGSLGIIALYLLGRELFGWQTALIATLFMLSWPFHIEFSRLALNQPGDALFGVLAFYFLARGLRLNTPRDFVLAGISLGIAQLFYAGARLIPIAMLIYVALLWRYQREQLKGRWRLLLLTVFAVAVVTLPQNYYLLRFQLQLSEHNDPYLQNVSILQGVLEQGQSVLQFVGNQLLRSFVGPLTSRDTGGWYGGTSPLMGSVSSALLVLGIAALWTRWRQRDSLLLLTWVISAVLLGSSLTLNPPQYQRYFPIAAPLALLVGVGIQALAFALIRLVRGLAHSDRFWVAVSIGVLLLVTNLIFYVNFYVPRANHLAKWSTWTINRVATEMLAAYAAGQQVVLLNGPSAAVENSPVVRYLMANKPYLVVNSATDDKLSSLDPNKPFVFVVSRNNGDDLEILKSRFPSCKVNEIYLDHLKESGDLAFYLYRCM